MNKLQTGLASLSALAFSAAALAAPDVTEVVAEIDGTATAVAAVGGAVLIIVVTAMVYKWIKRAF